MESSSREIYLKTLWDRYPEKPADAQAAGRILQIQDQLPGAFALTLLRAGKRTDWQWVSPCPLLAPILREGDLIAIQGQDILLLCPQLMPLPGAAFDSTQQKKWNDFLTALRSFFVKNEFFEVKTPSLVTCPGTEPSLDVFATELRVGSRRQKFFLRTSPELHLKKLLALGAENIFEMASCFRNGEITERHQPEFTMLEWYRAYENLNQIKKDVENLVESLCQKLQVAAPRQVKSCSVAELFKLHCGFDLKPETSFADLQVLAASMGLDLRAAETIDDAFFLIFMEKIEAQLDPQDLIFVENYPPYQAALARLTNEGWGDRFEVYWKGLELANAFHELNDPRIQHQRAQEDLKKKAQAGKEKIFLDEEFFQCLNAGLPPAAGIAVGVERLFMALTDEKNIGKVQLFPK